MAARARERTDSLPGRVVAAQALDRRSRVLSVSPARASGTGPFVTPRVADPDLAATLRALLDEVAEIMGRLDERLAALDGLQDGSRRASDLLQERLRVGASMLQAFEAQVSRVEAALADVDRRQQQLDERLVRFERALAANPASAPASIPHAGPPARIAHGDLRGELRAMTERLGAWRGALAEDGAR